MSQSKLDNPKFKIGDIVNCPKTLYKETEGRITDIYKVFKLVDENNRFVSGGLCISEDEIKSGFDVKYTFENNILKIYMPADEIKFHDGTILKTPARVETYLFYAYSYTIKSNKMNTRFSEKQLKLKTVFSC